MSIEVYSKKAKAVGLRLAHSCGMWIRKHTNQTSPPSIKDRWSNLKRAVLPLMLLPILLSMLCLPGVAYPDETEEQAPSNPMPTIHLQTGQRYPIEGVLATKASVQPPEIASVQQTPEGMLLVGRKSGKAKLSLETGGKQVQIEIQVKESPRTASLGPWSNALTELRKLPGIQISALGNKVLVQGEFRGREAYRLALQHAQSFPANLVLLALPGPGIRASLIEQAQTLLKGRGLTETRLTNAGNRFFLEGTVSAPEEVEQALELAQTVIPNVENHLAIPIRVEPTISVRVFLLELSRSAHRSLGLSWPGSSPQAISVGSDFLGFSPSWTATIQHLTANGEAKILAEPMLALKSGSTAELSAGGEIPIRITGKFDNRVVWKNYGLKVRIQIPGIAGKHIRTRLDTESSQLDDATAVDGVPGIRSNRMSTEIDVVEGQPVLLTGLFQSGVAKDIEKIPIIGSIPLIGELFKSRRFREHESELLVAVLPRFGSEGVKIPLQSLHGLEFDSRWRPLD